jgi:hypothetical protein
MSLYLLFFHIINIQLYLLKVITYIKRDAHLYLCYHYNFIIFFSFSSNQHQLQQQALAIWISIFRRAPARKKLLNTKKVES